MIEEHPSSGQVQPTHHHRHRARETRLRRLLRENRFEILWIFVAALGVFLIFEQMNIRGAITGWLLALVKIVFFGADHLQHTISDYASHAGLADVVGMTLIMLTAIAFIWRLRWRLMRTPKLTTIACPHCGGTIHRVHRRFLDHLISWLVPVRRYRCANHRCRWKGLRVTSGTGRSIQAGISGPPRANAA